MTVITGVAAALRIAIYLGYHRGRPLGFNDAGYYSAQAIALAAGRWFVDPTTGAPGAEHGPLTTVLVAPVSWIDQPEDWQRLATIVTGTLGVLVIGLLGRAVGRTGTDDGTRLGLLAAAIAAVYPNLWLNDGLVMSESPAALLVALWLLLAITLLRQPHDEGLDRRLVVLAVVSALATLARSELVLLVAFAVLIAWRVHRRPLRMVAVVALTALLVLAPWIGPNLVRFETPVTLSTNAGTTLRGSNCDITYAGRAVGSWSIFCLAIEPDTIGMETSRRDSRWRRDGIDYATDNLRRVPLVLLARLGRTLDLVGWEYALDEDVRDGRPRLGSTLGIAAFLGLTPLAVVGIRRWRGAERAVLLAPVAVVAVTTLAFYGGHRIRSPMEPVVVVAAAAGAVSLADRQRARRTSATPDVIRGGDAGSSSDAPIVRHTVRQDAAGRAGDREADGRGDAVRRNGDDR